MPSYIVTYGKYQLKFDHPPSKEELNTVLAKLGKTSEDVPEEERGFLEEAARGTASGIVQTGKSIAGGLGMAAAGGLELANNFTGMGEDSPLKRAQEKIFDEVSNMDEYWKKNDPLGQSDSLTGKVARGVGMIPTIVANPVLGLGSLIAGQGSEAAREHINAGGGVPKALAAQGVDTAAGVAGAAIPASIAARPVVNAAIGAGVNVAQEGLSHAAKQGIRKWDDAEALPDMTRNDYLAAAIPGGVIGLMTAKKGGGTNTNPNTNPSPSGAAPNKTQPNPDAFAIRALKRIEDREKPLLERKQQAQEVYDSIANSQKKTEKQLDALQKIKKSIEGIDAQLTRLAHEKSSYSNWLNRNQAPPTAQEIKAGAEEHARQTETTAQKPSAATAPTSQSKLVTMEDLNKIPSEGSAQRPVVDEGKPVTMEDLDNIPLEGSVEKPVVTAANVTVDPSHPTMTKAESQEVFQTNEKKVQKRTPKNAAASKQAADNLVKDATAKAENAAPTETPKPKRGKKNKKTAEDIIDELEAEEAARQVKEQNDQADGSSFKLSDVKVAELVKQGKFKEALEHIANKYDPSNTDTSTVTGKTRALFTTLARWMLANKNMDLSVTVFDNLSKEDRAFLEKNGVSGFHDSYTDVIGMARGQEGNIRTLFHEYIHRASTKLLDFVRVYDMRGDLSYQGKVYLENWMRSQPPEVIKATRNIIALWKELETLYAHPEGKGIIINGHHIYNIHEFFSEALTRSNIQGVLHDVILVPPGTDASKVNKFYQNSPVVATTLVSKVTSAMRLFRDSIRKMLGVEHNKDVTTALDILMENGKIIIEGSSGQSHTKMYSRMFDISSLDYSPDYFKKSATPQRIDQMLDLKSQAEPPMEMLEVIYAAQQVNDLPPMKIQSNVIGKQQFGEAIKNHPVTAQFVRAARLAEDTKNKFLATYLYGEGYQGEHKTFGPLMNLGNIERQGSIMWHIRNTPIADWGPVRRLMQWAGEQGINHGVVLQQHAQHLTAAQRTLYESLARTMFRTKVWSDDIYARFGGNESNLFEGYYPLVNKGDWEVLVSYQGATLEYTRFRSKAEADAWAAEARRSNQYRHADVVSSNFKKRSAEQNKGLIDLAQAKLDYAKEMQAQGKLTMQDVDDAYLELQRVADQAPLGGHNLRRLNVPGAEGQRSFRTERQLDEEFRQSFLDFGGEMASLAHRKIIQKYSTELLGNPELSDPAFGATNALRLVDDLTKLATGQQKVLFDSVWDPVETFMDNVFTKAAHSLGYKDWYPKNHVLSRTVGAATQLFYINALTARPAFWIAQVLSSPLAIRQLFRYGDTFGSMEAFGKGMATVLTGGDAGWHEMVAWARFNSNSLHPAFVNELNSLPEFKNLDKGEISKALSKVVPWATGQRFAEGADSASRYMAMAGFYHFWKDKGFTGEELYRRVTNDTDIAMVQYNNPNRSPIIRKMGKVGELVAPMLTFSTAQWGNLVADAQHFMKHKNAHAALPFIATTLTAMVMGGMMGVQGVAEYEVLRRIITWMAPDIGKHMPNLLETFNKEEMMQNRFAGIDMSALPRGAVSYGLPSAMSGFDVGSGLRWNSLISKSLTGEQGPLSILPAVNFAYDMGDAIITMGKYGANKLGAENMVGESDARTAFMKFGGFVVGGKGMMDVGFDSMDRRNVPGGSRGYAQRRQTDKETMAPFVGSSTLEAARKRTSDKVFKEKEDQRSQRKRDLIDKIADQRQYGHDNTFAYRELIKMGMSQKEIENLVEAAMLRRNIPDAERKFTNKRGQIKSKEQKRKFLEYQQLYGN